MVNIAINDYLSGKLILDNNKFLIERMKVSTTTSEKEELDTVMDAEMHLSVTMNNADFESSTNSMNKKAWNIGKEKTIN